VQITEAIGRHGGNRKAAARGLGIDPSTLFRKIKSLAVELAGERWSQQALVGSRSATALPIVESQTASQQMRFGVASAT
jgi:hypothetical protein